ncbi:MAG: protein kinase [Gammaproteobacteria bacterium]|jgi:serine/threonine protein kinase
MVLPVNLTSFAQTLRSFQSGAISREALFTEIEQRISSKDVDETWLLSTLESEQGRLSLPQEIFDAVRQRIVEAADKKMEKMAKTADMEENRYPGMDDMDDDLNRTQLATGFFNAKDTPEISDSKAVSSKPSVTGEEAPNLSIKGIGDTLNDRFILEERVGSGGMSTVYRALDRRKLEADDRDPHVAVKILNLEFSAHPDSLIALQREAKKCQRLAHPNIVRAYDFDRDGATVFMTMEYLSGHSLAEKLRRPDFKGMSCEEAMPIVEGMANALSFAHENGIVHADFKPANVILTDDGQIKVIDFGIARAFQLPGEGDMEATRFDPGSLGALTPTYASPEMLEHGEPDPRDDVYALACISYELFTGRHPFGRRQAIEARDGGLTPEWKKVLTRKQWKAIQAALEFDRDKRTPSVDMFRKNIRPDCSKKPRMALVASVVVTALVAGFIGIKYLDVSEPSFPFVAINADRNNTTIENTSNISDPEPNAELASVKSALPAESVNPPTSGANDTDGTEADRASFSSLVVDTSEVPEPVSLPKLTLAPVMSVLEAYPCSALTARLEGSIVNVYGFLNKSVSIKALTGKLSRIPGVTAVNTDITALTDMMCDVVDVYRPYWVLNRDKALGTSIEPVKQTSEFAAGESLIVKVTTPPFSSYINVDYYSLDGNVVHMLPSKRAKANQAPANYTARLGDLDQWVVSEPYGTELVVLLTTPESLFPSLRKEYETASEYLVALKDQLSRIDDESKRDSITSDFLLINTREKL